MAMATKVYQLRLQRKLSQAELAVRAGVTQGVISRLETHDDYNVSAAALKGLAMALGCTTDYLVGMHEDDARDEPPAARAPRGGLRTRAGEAR